MKLDKQKNRPYFFEPYNPKWIVEFNELKEKLSNVFGNIALSIEHVGSTSIPGMLSKPIIDVLITVSNLGELEDEKKKMTEMGYEWGENYIAPETLIFFKEGPNGEKTENIHVVVEGTPKAIQFITTRDYLKMHPDRARAYGDLKTKLKEEYPDDYPAYRNGKKKFLEETERLTKEWLANKKVG